MKNQFEKFRDLHANYINGNLTDFREGIKKLNKDDLLRFAQHIIEYNSASELNKIINFLLKK